VISAPPLAPRRDPLTISVILPVLNEARSVNSVIGHLRVQEPGVEIIVVDGDAAGGTIAAVSGNDVRAAVAAPGRANQMNRGAALATGDILLFLHADTLLPSGAFGRLRTCLADEDIVGGAFSLGIASPRWYFRVTERYVACRTRITRVPFGDQAVFLRRKYFTRIGGYASIPIMEDVELMARIRRRGDRICIVPDRVMTSPRRWEREGVVYTTARNWLLQFLYCCGVAPARLAKFYR
jgi:rSAM/selenodomain-associated transferase 2